MEAYDLEPERFKLVWCSSAEADRFTAAVTEMTETVRKLGPNPLGARAAGDAADEEAA